MNCKEYQKQIIAYLDGELQQDLANELNKHISGCKKCNDALTSLKNTYRIIELEKSEFKTDAIMSARVLAKIKNQEADYSTGRLSLRYISIASLAAAGIALGILIGNLYSTNSSSTTSSQAWDQLADEYMPVVENNPYNLIITDNETTIIP